MRAGYPTRVKALVWYVPILEAICLCFMLIGLGLWVHYTSLMYNSSVQGVRILRINVNSTPQAISKVRDSLVGTSVVYMIFASLVLVLGAWKGYLEVKQDLTGRLYEHLDWVLFVNMGLQGAWGLITLWLVLMLAADAVFAAWVYVLREATDSALTANASLLVYTSYASTIPTHVNAYNCPATCMNGNAFGFLVVTTPTPVWEAQNCMCDIQALNDAHDAFSTAFSAVGGTITGIVFMYLYGIFLAYNLTGMFTSLRMAMDLNERLLGIAA